MADDPTSDDPSTESGTTGDDARFDLSEYLLSRGIDASEVDRAAAAGPMELRRLAHAVVLLGEAPHLRPPEVWEQTGASEDLARQLWRAMGFAELPEEAVALTRADVQALATISDYLGVMGVREETAVRFTRLLGQTMGRVADALLSIVDQGLDEFGALPDGDVEDLMVVAADLVNPLIERELVYLLRRHLYAGAMRRLAGPEGGQEVAVVGFADVVSYTRLSGELPEGDLAELLETFEATTADAIADHGGRVVKLIGDAVMFSFDDAADAAELALDLAESFGGPRPDLRVGLAHGPVVSRLGDLFGPTVNLASRLVGFARPGTVIVDEAFVDALGDVPGFLAKSLRPRQLKGFGAMPLYVLRRERG